MLSAVFFEVKIMFYNYCGVVIADIDEYRPFLAACEQFKMTDKPLFGRAGCLIEVGALKVWAVCCGIGKVNAAAATAFLIADGVQAVFNVGLSGGMSGIARGQLSAPDRFYEHDFDLTPLGYQMGEKPQQANTYFADKALLAALTEQCPAVKVGAAVTGDCFVCDDGLRRRLNERYAPVTCDMETAAIASVCADTAVPFLSVRKVSDDAGDSARESYTDMNLSQNGDAAATLIALLVQLEQQNSKG